MNLRPLALSIALHAALVGAVWVGVTRVRVEPPQEPEPVFFELVEADAAPAAQQEPTPEPVDATSRRVEQETPVEHIQRDEPSRPQDTPEAADELPTPESAGQVDSRDEPSRPPDAPSHPQDTPEALEEAPVPESAGQVERAKVVSAPQALNRLTPEYPRSARRSGREGSVVVEATVLESGAVTDATVVTTSGYRDLDRAAVRAMKQATFAPAREDGVAVDGRIRLTFEFRLDR